MNRLDTNVSPVNLVALVAQQFAVLILDVPDSEAERITVGRQRSVGVYGLRCYASTTVLLGGFFDMVAVALMGERIPHRLYTGYLSLLQLVDEWLFPPTHRWRRHNTDIELLWGALHCCRSMLWLRKAGCCSQARAALQVLAPHHRDALHLKIRVTVTKFLGPD